MFRSRNESTTSNENASNNSTKQTPRRFSVTALANAIVPNLFADENTANLNMITATTRLDMLYGHQLASINPYNLDERSFYVAGVAQNEAVSRKVFKSLQKAEILSDEGTVDTRRIGRNFMHQVAILNAVRQKELINMLFWWEEECQRLRKLKSEEADISRIINESEKDVVDENSGDKEMLDQLKFARERVRMKVRQRPSERRADVEADTDNTVAEAFNVLNQAKIPPITGRSEDQSTLVSSSAHGNVVPEKPPAYYA